MISIRTKLGLPATTLVVLTVAVCSFLAMPRNASAQITLQLPSIAVFDVQTVVSVPDGGSTYLGGIGRSSAGQTTRGVPGLSKLPGVNRLFKNQAIGRETSNLDARVHVRVFSLKEMEAELMNEAAARAAARQGADPNGSLETQRKADFISRNIGRKKR